MAVCKVNYADGWCTVPLIAINTLIIVYELVLG